MLADCLPDDDLLRRTVRQAADFPGQPARGAQMGIDQRGIDESARITFSRLFITSDPGTTGNRESRLTRRGRGKQRQHGLRFECLSLSHFVSQSSRLSVMVGLGQVLPPV